MIHLIYETHMVDRTLVAQFKDHFEDVNLITLDVRWGVWENSLQKYLNFWRNYISLAVTALRNSNTGDTLIFWQVFAGTFGALLNRILRLDRKIVILSFIHRERNSKSVERVRHLFINFALGGTDRIICYSKYEENLYRRMYPSHANKIWGVLLGQTILENRDGDANRNESYLFSAGQSNRNFELIIEAMRFVPSKLIIATSSSISVPEELKKKVTVLRTNEEEYFNFIKNALFVLIPLQSRSFSSGQLVLLHSRAFAKACLISETNWNVDYISHRKNGFVVTPNTSESWATAINLLLDNQELREEIENNSALSYKNTYNSNQFALKIIEIIEELNKS